MACDGDSCLGGDTVWSPLDGNIVQPDRHDRQAVLPRQSDGRAEFLAGIVLAVPGGDGNEDGEDAACS